jgi:hypothetical protein
MSEQTVLQIIDLDDLPVVEGKTAIVVPDGREGWLYPSGVIKDKRGKFMFQPKNSKPFTSDTAKSAVLARERQKREAALAAVEEGGGWKALFSTQVEIAKDPKRGRDATTAVKELQRASGVDRVQSEQQGANGSVQGFTNKEMGILRQVIGIIGDKLGEQNTHDNNTNQEQSNQLIEGGTGDE